MARRVTALRRKEIGASDTSDSVAVSAETGASPTDQPGSAIGISVQGLTKVYERFTRREIVRTRALAGVDLEVKPKEFVSLIGPSGCGKTTVLKILAGLLTPTAGSVRIGDKEVRGPGTDRATVFQSPGLMPWKTVIDNVVLALDFAGKKASSRLETARKYVDLVGLGDFHDHHPGELSGGMQQRVGIARALAIEPNVLLMDEPFGALDAITRAQMQTELLGIWEREKRTVLFVTHSMDEAILLSDRIIVMREGTIISEVEVSLPRPRQREEMVESQAAAELKRRLVEMLH
ncbi:MAG: ABC transporter ATP-binding protein [Actinomycetota bacterium]|nr:ABC transporter ATP-binding protein [Actinomycetota bacterium]